MGDAKKGGTKGEGKMSEHAPLLSCALAVEIPPVYHDYAAEAEEGRRLEAAGGEIALFSRGRVRQQYDLLLFYVLVWTPILFPSLFVSFLSPPASVSCVGGSTR